MYLAKHVYGTESKVPFINVIACIYAACSMVHGAQQYNLYRPVPVEVNEVTKLISQRTIRVHNKKKQPHPTSNRNTAIHVNPHLATLFHFGYNMHYTNFTSYTLGMTQPI